MDKKLVLATKSKSLNSVMRVINTLNRKEFEVVDISMEGLNKENTSITITINESPGCSAINAKNHLEKIIDIDEISIL